MHWMHLEWCRGTLCWQACTAGSTVLCMFVTNGCQITGLDEDAEVTSDVQIGEAHLFFGCRRSDHDFLYSAELQKHETTECLTRLHVAFSREQAFKVYVQHRMRENADLLASLILEGNASIFICGDGQNMSRDVRQCLADIFQVCLARVWLYLKPEAPVSLLLGGVCLVEWGFVQARGRLHPCGSDEARAPGA